MRTFNAMLSRGATALPVIARLITGIIMTAHGWQKLTQMGPANFGNGMLAGLGVPLPVAAGYAVTFIELAGGILLIVGLLTRVAALLNIVVLSVATLLVKVDIGLLGGADAPMAGAELDLAIISGLLVSLLLGPGIASLDKAFGLDDDTTVTLPESRSRDLVA